MDSECFQVTSLWQLNLLFLPPYPTCLHAHVCTNAPSKSLMKSHWAFSASKERNNLLVWSPLHMICQPCCRKRAKEKMATGRESAEERGGLYIRFSSFMISDTLIQLDNQREKPPLWIVGLRTHLRYLSHNREGHLRAHSSLSHWDWGGVFMSENQEGHLRV